MNEPSEHASTVENRSGRGILARYAVPLLILAAVLGGGIALMLFSSCNPAPSRPEAAPVASPDSSYPRSTPAASPYTANSGNTINTSDPLSGKSVTAGITSTYKGHVIGHCCEEGRRRWNALAADEKDAHLARMLGK